jgi:hypothetical protein
MNVVWAHLLDGGGLTRDRESDLLSAGKWDVVELRGGTGERWFQEIPHIVGLLLKGWGVGCCSRWGGVRFKYGIL